MKITLTLTAFFLLLTACTTGNSDASIRRRLVGVWALDSQPRKIGDLRADGTVVMKKEGAETITGRWLVRNGCLIEGPAEAWSNVAPSQIETNKVLSISGDKAVLLSVDGHSPLTLRRQ